MPYLIFTNENYTNFVTNCDSYALFKIGRTVIVIKVCSHTGHHDLFMRTAELQGSIIFLILLLIIYHSEYDWYFIPRLIYAATMVETTVSSYLERLKTSKIITLLHEMTYLSLKRIVIVRHFTPCITKHMRINPVLSDITAGVQVYQHWNSPRLQNNSWHNLHCGRSVFWTDKLNWYWNHNLHLKIDPYYNRRGIHRGKIEFYFPGAVTPQEENYGHDIARHKNTDF